MTTPKPYYLIGVVGGYAMPYIMPYIMPCHSVACCTAPCHELESSHGMVGMSCLALGAHQAHAITHDLSRKH